MRNKIALLIACLCTLAAVPQPPRLPKRHAVLMSPKHTLYVQSLGKPMAPFAVTSRGYSLAWNYSLPVPTNIVFDVLTSTNFATPWRSWPVYATTTNLTVPMATTNPLGFFAVRARDIVNGLTSP